MSRQRQGIKLPHALRKELGLDENPKSRRRNGGQRERRERGETREGEQRNNMYRKPQGRMRDDEGKQALPRPFKPSKLVAPAEPKSILKKTSTPVPPKIQAPLPEVELESEASSDSSRASSPEIVLDANSRSFRDKQAEEDAEIAALEKRLGAKGGKAGKLFEEDGFGDLLNGLDEEVAGLTGGEKRKRQGEVREDREWIERKRRKAAHSVVENGSKRAETSSDKGDIGGDLADRSEDDFISDDEYDDSDALSGDDFGGFDSGEDDTTPPPARQPRVRENPYVAPVPATASTAKYIPPSLRKSQSSNGQDHDRIRKQLQGHLNKLSEANLISIQNEVEQLYQRHPRQDVTTVLLDLLLTLFCDRSSLQNTFVILHAAFITAIYKVIGTDFGAELLSQIVDRFTQYHTSTSDCKESLNLLSLLSNLFIFNMIASPLIYDHIHLLLSSLTESNTELLLRLIRDCGPQLRSDDPSALKAVVSKTQATAKALESSDTPVSVRTRFMIETIMDLKNNKMRDHSTGTSAFTKEHITRMRKVLGSLNSRSLRATEPLRISLADLQNSDRKGKWWLVGASWKGNDTVSPTDDDSHQDPGVNQALESPLSLEAAEPTPKQFGLTTPLQQNIFAAIAKAQSYVDAHVRLTKLRLTRSQEPEIARVLLRLCASEQSYNPFYALVAKRLCTIEGGKRIRKTFDFALWGFFRRLGETEGEDGDDHGGRGAGSEEVAVEEINNVAHLYASLVYWGLVSLAVLRVLDLLGLGEEGVLVVEMMLVRVFVLCKGQEDAVETVFDRVREAEQVVPRLKLFLREHVKHSDLVGSKEEKNYVRKGCRVAGKVLERISSNV